MSFTNSVKNDPDTEVVRINGIGICENCRDERDDLLEVNYLEYSYGPEFSTPTHRTTEVVCDNCFDEHY